MEDEEEEGAVFAEVLVCEEDAVDEGAATGSPCRPVIDFFAGRSGNASADDALIP